MLAHTWGMALSIHTLPTRRWRWPDAQLLNTNVLVPGTVKVKESSLTKSLLLSFTFCGTLLQTQTSLEGKKWPFVKVNAKRSYNLKDFAGNTQCSQMKYRLVIIGCSLQWVNNLLQPATKTGMKWPAKTCLPASVQIPLPLFSPDSFYSVARKDFSLHSVLLIFLPPGLLWCLRSAAVALQVSAPWKML